MHEGINVHTPGTRTTNSMRHKTCSIKYTFIVQEGININKVFLLFIYNPTYKYLGIILHYYTPSPHACKSEKHEKSDS